MRKKEPSFWVTNISNRNVSLADLALTIPAFTSVNLLDKKHYQYTPEQLEKSCVEGSMFAKKHAIRKRVVPPTVIKVNVPVLAETYLTSRERSTFKIEEKQYEELQVSDEEYLKEENEGTDTEK